MYMHIDTSAYEFAHITTAESHSICGACKFLRVFHPLGNKSRDIGQFIDDSGKHYLISSDSVNKFYIYENLRTGRKRFR